jgi:YfiH family protein
MSETDPPLRFWPQAADVGVSVAVTTRHGGVSQPPYDSLNLGLHVGDDQDRVIVNRVRAARAFGVPLRTMVFADQVHGAGVTVVDHTDQGRGIGSTADAVPRTDILVTTATDTTLVILVADCVPLALVDPEAHVLGAVHAGWRGTAAGAIAHALNAMARLGARPERTMAFVGPAVHPARYQVSGEVERALAGAIAPVALDRDVARPDGPDHWLIDLPAANRQQLREAGVDPAHIFGNGASTTDDDFYSDRAARPCGRFGLLARLLPT